MKFVWYFLLNCTGAFCVWVEEEINDFIINLTDPKQQYPGGIAPFKDSSLRQIRSVDPCSLLLLNSLQDKRLS